MAKQVDIFFLVYMCVGAPLRSEVRSLIQGPQTHGLAARPSVTGTSCGLVRGYWDRQIGDLLACFKPDFLLLAVELLAASSRCRLVSSTGLVIAPGFRLRCVLRGRCGKI